MRVKKLRSRDEKVRSRSRHWRTFHFDNREQHEEMRTAVHTAETVVRHKLAVNKLLKLCNAL